MIASCGHTVKKTESHYRYADGRTVCNQCAAMLSSSVKVQRTRGQKAADIKDIDE